jgi:DNA-binding NarL/FixJ family response regulator
MNRQPIRAFIITRSVPLADGLDALLRAISQIDEIEIARNLEQAFERIERRKPRILLIDAILIGNRPEELLEQIAFLSPETQRVLLVENAQDVKWMPQYAEAVLIKGISPAAVAGMLTNLLSSKGDEHEHDDPNP